MSRAGALARRKAAGLAPPPGLAPSMVVQAFTYSLGTGFYTAGSAIFFTLYVGLPAKQIAAGVSIAALATFALRIPIGLLADRLGGRSTWRVGAGVQALLFTLYPLVHGFGFFAVVITGEGLSATTGMIGRSRYIGEVLPKQDRVKVNAYLRSVINIGLALGTLPAGALTQVHSHRWLAGIVLINALTFYLDVVLLTFWIKPAPRKPATRKAPAKGRAALTDRPFVALSALRGVFTLSDVLLTTVIPLWLLQSARGHGQKSMIPALLLLNMLMVTLLQVRAGRGVDGVPEAARRQRSAGILLASACALIPTAAHTTGAWTWLVVLSTAAVLTQAELYTAVAGWGLSYGLSPDDRLGEYLAVFGWGSQIAQILGPSAIIAVVTTTSAGWYIVAAMFLLAGLASVPLVEAVRRGHAARVVPGPGAEAAAVD